MKTKLRAVLASAVIALGLAGASVTVATPAQADDWGWRRHQDWREIQRQRAWREREWAREREWRHRHWREREWRERHWRQGYNAPRPYYYAPPRSTWR